jgi:hypothetical protein
MPGYFAVLTIVLMLGMVLARVATMKRNGVEAMHFGKTHKTDFFIPPFALFYFYIVLAAAFRWPTISTQEFFPSEAVAWLCFASILLGQFLIFSNWILLVYVGAGIWLFHRQVLREEAFLKAHYGQAYAEYCKRVRRYI